MVLDVRLLPGFPLPAHDYAELIGGLARYEGPQRRVVVAHSLGALEALSLQPDLDVPVFLLAPSSPHKRRSARPLLQTCLRTLGHARGIGEMIARLLREHTYQRYAATPPTGDPLPLEQAADRLRSAVPSTPRTSSGPCIIFCSVEDPRHPAQLALAGEIGANVHWIDGGHLFPVTRGQATAEAILDALRDLNDPD